MRSIGAGLLLVGLAGALAACAAPGEGPGRSRERATTSGAGRELEPASPEVRPAKATPEARYTIEVEDADLRDVVDELARRSGRKLTVDPDVHERVTVSMRDLPLLSADGVVDTLAKMTKCEIVQRGDVTVLTQPPILTLQDGYQLDVKFVLKQIAEFGGKSVVFVGDIKGLGDDFHNVRWDVAFKKLCSDRQLFATRSGSVITVSTEPLGFGSADLAGDDVEVPASAKQATGAVDLDVKEASVATVLDAIARQSGASIVLEGSTDVTLTFAVRAAPWRDVLAFVARAAKLRLHEERGVIVAEAVPPLTLQAQGAQAGTWFKLLARESGKSIVMPAHLTMPIDADLKGVSPLEALVVTARANGYEVVDGRDGIVAIDDGR